MKALIVHETEILSKENPSAVPERFSRDDRVLDVLDLLQSPSLNVAKSEPVSSLKMNRPITSLLIS